MDIKDVDVMAVVIQDEGVSDAGIKDEGIIEGFIYEGQPDGAVWKGMLAGLAGGLAASWTMNRFQAGLSKLAVHQNGGASDSRQVQGDDATVKAASAVSETLTHHKLAPDEKRMAGPVVHYVFGSTIRRSLRRSSRNRAGDGQSVGSAVRCGRLGRRGRDWRTRRQTLRATKPDSCVDARVGAGRAPCVRRDH